MYSKRFINISALILTIIIFLITNYLIVKVNNLQVQSNETEEISEEAEEIIEKEIDKNLIAESNLEQDVIDITQESQIFTKWEIEIPKISLKAPISEGTEADILNEYVGHFKETSKLQGNIGLAAHNRGYPINYFAKLKDLNEGDEIIYRFGENEKIYMVIRNMQISDIDWSYLQNTEENKITLITCIENKPSYRRCVQAIEKIRKEI